MRAITTGSTNMASIVNAAEAPRLWLFEMDVPDGADSVLYFAQSRESVSYRGRTYVSWPIEHEGIEENSQSEIDTITLRVGNLTEDISALLELYDGMRNQQVRVLQVIDVTDADACIEDKYYVDSVKVGKQSAEFTLATRFSIMEAQIAPRMYNRSYCRWNYKGRGCWRGSAAPWTQPTSWTLGGGDDTCKHTPEDCKRHQNYEYYGGFPGIPNSKLIRV